MKKLGGFALACVCILGLVSLASAQIGIGAGIHGGYGIYSTEESNGGMDFGLNVNISIMPMLSGQLFADYFLHSESHDSTLTEQYDLKYTDIPIGLHLIYDINIPGSPIKPYLGAGASVHIFSSKFTYSDAQMDTTVSETKFGVGGVGGVEFTATPQLGIFLELRDHYILTSEEIEGTTEKTKNTNALYILGGVNYHFM